MMRSDAGGSDYSISHDAFYRDMAQEMLRYAGFQDGVNVRLRYVAQYGGFTRQYMRWCDDLYGIYGDAQVME